MHLFGTFLCLLCLLERDSRLITVCYTLISCLSMLLSLIHRQFFQKQRIASQFITGASRIWSPFYYRACFPRCCPPQMQWTEKTSEEPVKWEKRKNCGNFSSTLFTSAERTRLLLETALYERQAFTSECEWEELWCVCLFGSGRFSWCLLLSFELWCSPNNQSKRYLDNPSTDCRLQC